MFTNEGFKFLIQAPDAERRVSYILIGKDKSEISDLSPDFNIMDIQSVKSEDRIRYNVESSIFTEANFHLGLKYIYDLNFYTFNNENPNYCEYGVYGENDKLLYYHLNTNADKTFLFEVKNQFLKDNFKLRINLTQPFKNKSLRTSLKSENVLTDYDVIYKSIPYESIPNFSIERPMTCLFKNTLGEVLSFGEIGLESFNTVTREAIINLKVSLDSTQLESSNYIYFSSFFCNLKISLKDIGTGLDKPWPLTNGESIIIPLKVYVGANPL